MIIRSVLSVFFLSLRHSGAGITINSTSPEKLIYLLWVPFIRINYISHTSVFEQMYPFTSISCNTKLGQNKRIITVSQASKALICKNWKIKKDKWSFIAVIYNCLPTTMQGDDCPDRIPEEKTVITLGHVIEYKNPFVWFEVAKIVTSKYKQVKFIWLGNGPLYDQFKNEAQGYDNITFRGLINEPGNWLMSASIYYQPSLHETQGIAVIEAMASSLPCVVSKVGGLPESVQHNYNGLLVSPLDVKEHVNAISTLLDDDDLRVQYGRNSQKRYLQSFSYEQFKRSMDAVNYC
ncbi:MAG: glycosyltransferase family 4 protein [Mucilaginibacter sp.]